MPYGTLHLKMRTSVFFIAYPSETRKTPIYVRSVTFVQSRNSVETRIGLRSSPDVCFSAKWRQTWGRYTGVRTSTWGAFCRPHIPQPGPRKKKMDRFYPHSLLGLHSMNIKAPMGLHPEERSNHPFLWSQTRVVQP